MSYYLKKFWKINCITVIFQILAYGFQAVLNLVQMQALQHVFEQDFLAFVFTLTIILVGWAFHFFFKSVGNLFRGKAIKAMNNQLRRDVSATLLHKSHQEYHSNNTGEYLSWFTNNIKQIESSAWGPFFDGVGLVAQIIWSMIVLASLHWSLLIAALVAALILMVAPMLFGSKLESLGQKCAHANATAISHLKDLLMGYDVLHLFGFNRRFAEQSDSISDQIETAAYRQSYTMGFISGAMGFVVILTQVLINVLIGFLSINGLIIQSALFGGGSLCGAISNGLNNLANIRMAFATSKPYFEVISVHASECHTEAKPSFTPVFESISVDHLSFQYGEKPVIKDMTIRFEKGGKYALTGPSGCGKSTLLKLLLGWLPEYTGSIQLDGRDARSFTTEQLQQQMSYIEQDVFLFNTTIRENITLGEKFSEAQMAKALHDSALDADLANMPLGLDTPVGEEGSCLSGGQKQRVAIARALIHNRSILLVDEGTSALDQKNADIVEKSLLSNPDLTLILVSHHLSPERKVQFDEVFELEPVRVAV